ncbi:hypothetical protein FOA52_005463 [Chlamydomonas sp. UWO 241]|nr:hypothetical protein FOA52_005463 [Chlamydomonas sp. UWO 241]
MRWWQAFKPRLAREARRLDCDLGRRRDAVSVEVTRLRADLQRARAAVEAGRDGLAELAGLYALQRRLDAAAVADAAGALVVTPAEVRAAATHSKPGTAPGPDGIPVDVWRKLGEPAFELLAAVFTAVGATGGTPPGFLDGVVASIYKAKNAADAANYRPLTMLGSDYRILAKVLATRWTPLLSAVVGPEQTAFLAGRRISDNICLTQMLPGLLAANAAEGVGPTGAALALLDFRKAYDTIDRGFLIAVMEAVGVGDGVLAWTRTILTHTYASAEVNGFISAPRKYAAGVRQGCPAAPALFLFLGHALACFLRTCPAVGVEVVPGCRVTCPQYADDCMPLLRSCAPADVAALVETMAVFGRATGLVLNLGKCGILPLGSAGEGLLAGAEVAGLRVLDAGVSLGVPVSAGLPPPEGVTGVCRERLAAAYTKLARFPMSAFGRGHAAATYGVSRILFRAVHCGMTPEAERVLSRWTATLVDRSVGPDPPAELPRWASSVPGAGGGGAGGSGGGGGGGTQPEQQPAPPAQPAWQPLMVEAVHRLCPEAHPSLFVLMAGLAPRAGALPDGLIGECVDPAVRAALLAGPMRRMLDGVQALGPVARITGRVQTAELWGAEAPLWANPLLQLELPAAQRSVQWREPTGDAAGHALFSPTDAARWLVDGLARVRDALPGMRTVTDLCVLWAWLAAVDMVFRTASSKSCWSFGTDASYLGSTRHVRRLFSDCYGSEETAVAAAAVQVDAAAVDGVSLPVCLAMNLVRFVHDVSGGNRPAGGGVVSASFLNAKPAVGGIGVEPRRGGVLHVLFTVASDAVADTVVRSRRNLRDVDPSAAVFDVLSDREEAQHRALWPAFLAAKAAGKRAQFHRARLVVDGERVPAPAC